MLRPEAVRIWVPLKLFPSDGEEAPDFLQSLRGHGFVHGGKPHLEVILKLGDRGREGRAKLGGCLRGSRSGDTQVEQDSSVISSLTV